ncbi:MAG TPA: hypothetical protein DCP36_17140, partial [Sporomusaceae bacterium]|nr:hypothetical protein [Sporomusaceae bacterium]
MLIEQGGWSRELDEVSCHRETIVKKLGGEDFTHIRPMDPLLDAAVDLIQWYAEHHQASLEQLIVGWNDSKIPMLQRLSLYAVSLANWNEDKKCQWLLRKQILHWTVFYRESYQLLGSIFINLSPAIKEEAISTLLQLVYHDPDDGKLNHNRSLRTYYLLKSMAAEKHSESKQLAAAVETVKTLLENAGIEYQTTDADKETVTIDISALLAGDVLSALQWYDEIAQPDDFFNKNSNKEKFEIAFREKAAKELAWAISIADILWQEDNKNAHYLSRTLLGILG